MDLSNRSAGFGSCRSFLDDTGFSRIESSVLIFRIACILSLARQSLFVSPLEALLNSEMFNSVPIAITPLGLVSY